MPTTVSARPDNQSGAIEQAVEELSEIAMRDEIGRSQGASVADVVDPTSRWRNEAERSISPHPFVTPRFFVSDASAGPGCAGLSDGSSSDCTSFLPGCEKAPGVASNMRSSTAC